MRTVPRPITSGNHWSRIRRSGSRNCSSTIFVVRRLPCRSTLQVFSGGWIQRPKQFEEFSLAHSTLLLLEYIPL